MGDIRVVIADDSQMVRELLRDILARDPEIQVVGEAKNGQEAVTLARSLRPDLITMDLNMPVMDGLSAIEELMHTRGLPILVVSDRSDAQTAYHALEVGALELIAKPSTSEEDAERFTQRVRLLAGVAVITRLRRRSLPPPAIMHTENTRKVARAFQRVVAITCSTGGPQALLQLLRPLPVNFPAPILIAQHISDGFIEGMAKWLSSLCAMPVTVAAEGELLRAGHIYLSPSERDLSVTPNHRLQLLTREQGVVYRPSGDVMLKSVATVYSADAIGVILTGMGRDGVNGMRTIYQAGGTTLAQDEASSVIYGMNQEAVKAGVIQHVLPLEKLPARLLRETGFTTHLGEPRA
ncbi:MAG: chemotaxis-specific protein-glutamate methyltransferase CheB [Pseudomonadota bacterium]